MPSLNAARRAAHLLERRGQVQVLHVAVPAGLDQKGGTFLVRRVRDGGPRLARESALRLVATEGPPLDSRHALTNQGSMVLAAIVAGTRRPGRRG